jgi:hypothetical protein
MSEKRWKEKEIARMGLAALAFPPDPLSSDGAYFRNVPRNALRFPLVVNFASSPAPV